MYPSRFFVLGGGIMAVSLAAHALVEVGDGDLAAVQGQDGVALNLKGFSFRSDTTLGQPGLTLTYTIPNSGDLLGQDTTKPVDFIRYSGIEISRTDPANASDIFNDPYELQIEAVIVPDNIAIPAPDKLDDTDPLKTNRRQDVIRLKNPKNLAGELKWNSTYDWTVATGVSASTGGTVHDMGAKIVKNMVVYGGGLSLAPAWSYQHKDDVRGTAFGLDLNVAIESMTLRPRGRNDAATEMAFNGIRIGAANAAKTGVDTDVTKTWAIADVIAQPGIISTITDSNGESVLRMGIEWYRGPDGSESAIPVGAVSIDSIVIKNSANPSGMNLGAASIGGIQIRYLDVRFRQ